MAVAFYTSPVGGITLKTDGTALTGLWFNGQRHFPKNLINVQEADANTPVMMETCRWLDLYFKGVKPMFMPEIHLNGTPFQLKVWHKLLTIQFGDTMTYGQIAKSIERDENIPYLSPQAVGAAVGRNPVSIIVPCHRVIGANGALVGYAAGVDVKRWLLNNEQQKR